MAKRIKAKRYCILLEQEEVEALVSVLGTCLAVMEQDDHTVQEIELVEKALKRHELLKKYFR